MAGSLFDSLLSSGIPADADSAAQLAKIKLLLGKNPQAPTTQAISPFGPGLTPPFTGPNDQVARSMPTPRTPMMPDMKVPDYESLVGKDRQFDIGTSLDKLKDLNKDATDKKTKSIAERVEEILRAQNPNMVNTGTAGNEDIGAAATQSGVVGTPRKRYLNPMQGPDTGEEVADMPGVPKGYFGNVESAEAAGKLDAINPVSHALGLYQFLPTTLSALKKQFPELKVDANWRNDRDQQNDWMRAFTQLSLDKLKPIIGDRMPTKGELHLMHFFGQSGGASVLNNLGKRLGDILPDIVFKQNPSLNKNQTAADYLNAIERAWGSS